MTTSFFNGLSGLKSFQAGIDIWGDNISNINTTAFKKSIPEFETIFSSNLSTSPISSDVGLGSVLHSSAKDMSEGSLIHTDKVFDLALDDEGWFEIKKGEDSFYTRDGRFSRDANGYLVNDNGGYLLVANANNLIQTNDGYVINSSINTDDLVQKGAFSPISLPDNVVLPAVATKNVDIKANLNNDDTLEKISPATEDLYFSALYDKDGNFLNMVDGNSIAYTLGDNIDYNGGFFEKEICIGDDEKNNQDVNIDFLVNDKPIQLTLPDGSTKEEIINALSNELDKNGILYDKTDNGIVIKSQNKLVIKSNTDFVTSAAGYKFVYKNNPTNENEFNTISSFANKLQNALNTIYPNLTQVSTEDGKIVIQNLSLNKTIESKFEKTEDNNEAFFNNIYSLGNTIIPDTAAKSALFSANNKSLGGYIYEANGDKDTLSIEFVKKEVLNNTTIWNAKVSVLKDDNVISQNNYDFTFDSEGHLISPKQITISSPQSITINTDISAFRGINNKIAYSFTQDGISKGYLQGYEINQHGDIFANFSNERSVKLATIPVFHFANDKGLESIGNSLFRQTDNSNKAFLYKDMNGKYITGANVHSRMLETSNVTMNQAMTELIVTQKAFSAAAKTVTTSDEMIQRAINMKRG